MSKKKTGATAPAKKNLVVIRGYPAWGEWLESLASQNNAPVTVTIDQALRMLSDKIGHRPPPKRY